MSAQKYYKRITGYARVSLRSYPLDRGDSMLVFSHDGLKTGATLASLNVPGETLNERFFPRT